MKKIIFVFFILFVFVSSIYAGEFYNCIDRDGNTILTNSPQDGMKKCVLKESYKDPTPEEVKAQEQRESERKRVQQKYQISSPTKSSHNNKSETYKSGYEDKCKGLRDNFNRAYKKHEEEEKRRIDNGSKNRSSEEISARAAMFKAQEEEHACLFSPENIKKGNVYQETTTTTITRGKSK